MKNNKIVTLTIAIVVVALVTILALSKAFEIVWQKENTVDNILSAEVVDDSGTVFDYPFIIDNGETIDWDEEYITVPPADAISYQEAANIAGETLKYMYGYTIQQTVPGKICYHDRPESASQFPGIKDYYYYFKNEDIEAFVFIEPYTGEPTLFQLVNMSDIEGNNDIQWQDLEQLDKKKLMSDVSSILQYLNKPEAMKIGVSDVILSDCNNKYIKVHQTSVVLVDGTQVQLWLAIGNNDGYHQLVTYKNLTIYGSDNLYFNDIEFFAEEVK